MQRVADEVPDKEEETPKPQDVGDTKMDAAENPEVDEETGDKKEDEQMGEIGVTKRTVQRNTDRLRAIQQAQIQRKAQDEANPNAGKWLTVEADGSTPLVPGGDGGIGPSGDPHSKT